MDDIWPERLNGVMQVRDIAKMKLLRSSADKESDGVGKTFTACIIDAKDPDMHAARGGCVGQQLQLSFGASALKVMNAVKNTH